MNHEEKKIAEQLQGPFAFGDVRIRVKVKVPKGEEGANGEITEATATFHLEESAIQKRLDSVSGIFGWCSELASKFDKTLSYGLSLFFAERGEWVTKYGEAGEGAFIKAAELWGIGRYLRQIPPIPVEAKRKGDDFDVKDGQESILRAAYQSAVSLIFGSNAGDSSDDCYDSNGDAADQNGYKVHSIKPSGKNSHLLELLSDNGKSVTAFVKNDDHSQAIKVGSYLLNVQIEQKSSNNGNYNLITAYRIHNYGHNQSKTNGHAQNKAQDQAHAA